VALEVYDFRQEEDQRYVLVTPQIRSRLLRLEPGPGGGEFHSHDLGHEIFLILQGRCVFEIGGEEAELGPGQMCVALADQPHRVHVIGDEPVIMYLSVTPHILPTHTGRTADGGRHPVRIGGLNQFDTETDVKTPMAALVDSYIETAEAAADALRASAEEAAALKEANGSGEDAGEARLAVWENLCQAFTKVYDLGDVWNNVAPRAGHNTSSPGR
jgi:quercetin dioxygenase-like cupin family protein